MRNTRLTIVSVVTLLAAVAAAAAASARRPMPDVSVTVSGAAAAGETVAIACNLALIAAPSNLYTGACDVAVGGDHVIVTGLTGSPERALTVVLNGQVTIRGSAVSGSRRFSDVVRDSAEGFPVRIQIDPLTRRFTIASDGPAGEVPLTAGRLSHGDVLFTVQ